jgi:hypothetical protein
MEVSRSMDVTELGQAATEAVTDSFPKGKLVTSRAVTEQPVTRHGFVTGFVTGHVGHPARASRQRQPSKAPSPAGRRSAAAGACGPAAMQPLGSLVDHPGSRRAAPSLYFNLCINKY